MKETEFRVWDKKDKSMHIVISLHHPNYLDCCEYAVGQSSGDVRSIQYKDCVVMQFTGLKDKNKEKIYEGDILKSPLGNIYVIKWNNYSSSFVGGGNSISQERVSRSEVIGNIYENPRHKTKTCFLCSNKKRNEGVDEWRFMPITFEDILKYFKEKKCKS